MISYHGRPCVELRIGPQKPGKRREITLEPELIDDGQHLGPNARDLLDTDGVNLRGIDIGERRVAPNLERVVVVTARQVQRTNRRRGLILVAQILNQRLERREHVVAQQRPRLAGKPCVLGRRKQRSRFFYRLKKAAVLGIRLDLSLERRQYTVDDDSRQDKPAFRAAPHVGDILLEVAR